MSQNEHLEIAQVGFTGALVMIILAQTSLLVSVMYPAHALAMSWQGPMLGAAGATALSLYSVFKYLQQNGLPISKDGDRA